VIFLKISRNSFSERFNDLLALAGKTLPTTVLFEDGAFENHLAYPSPTSAENNAALCSSAAQTINIKLISSSDFHPRSE